MQMMRIIMMGPGSFQFPSANTYGQYTFANPSSMDQSSSFVFGSQENYSTPFKTFENQH